MKLQEKAPNKKVSTKKSSKKLNKKKKGPQLREDYTSMTPCRAEKAELSLTKMTYGFIESHEVKYIRTPDGVINLNDSWLELLLLMLNMVITEHPTDYRTLLCNNRVTSQTFIVDKSYGVYTFDNRHSYKVFKIYDSELYLESLFESSDIFLAIVGLTKICGMAIDEIVFGLISKEFIERKLDFNKLADGEHIVKISDVASSVKSGMLLVEISIMNERVTVQDFNLLLYVFCKWVLDNYGSGALLKLPKHKNAGLTNECTDESLKYNQLLGTDMYIYTNNDTASIIKFIKSSLDKLGISEDTVFFKFKSLKEIEEKQPWLYEKPYQRKWR